jgi:hypothetical protein
MSSFWPLACGLIGIAATLVVYLHERRNRVETLAIFRLDEMKAFAELKFGSSGKPFSVDAVSATTVVWFDELRQLETGHVSYCKSTRYLRNEHGEYFYWFWYSGHRPYVKHMSHVNARVVLKARYVEPEAAA